MASLAIPAFIVSAASTLSLQADLLSGCGKLDNGFFQTCLSAWSHEVGEVLETLPTKRSFWDQPGMIDKALVETTLSSAHHQASFLAASTQHSGDWLFALPIWPEVG